MNISIVIPNYNGEAILKKNLPKVFEEANSYKLGKAEIIVVDDGSTDGSLLSLNKFKADYKLFKLIINENNLGFSSTVNRGVKAASGEIVVLLNTDVYPEKGFLDFLINDFQKKDVFAVACLDKSIENGKIELRGRGVGSWKRGFLVHQRGDVSKRDTLWASGGSSAFRKSIWDQLRGLNELYNPFYWEDIDLSYRALKSGYKVLFEPRSVVFHEHEKGAIKTKFKSSQIKTTAYRNQFIFVWENATDIFLRITHVVWLPYHFTKALLRGDLPFFVGFIKAFLLLPKIIIDGFTYQKSFVRKDKEVVEAIV
jgi:O-antigen biosynthesis protein